MWWAITTLTTVGYGDVTPHTVAGRLIAVGLMIIGIAFLSLLTATIAARFIEEDTRLNDLIATVERIETKLVALEDELRLPAREGSDRESR